MGEVNMEELSRASQTPKFEIEIQPFILSVATRMISELIDGLPVDALRSRNTIWELVAALRKAKQIEVEK